MTTTKALLLLNPGSRRGDDPGLVQAREQLQAGGLELVPAAPENAEQLASIIARYRDEVDLVIIAGGDGTLNAAAGSLHQYRLPLGILPMGTANDLARTLRIPENLERATRIILDGYHREVDLGLVNDHYFFNVAHIGLGTEITHELSASAKKHWGVFSYLKTFFTALRHSRNFWITLTVDGEPQHMRTIHVAVGNGCYYGGGNLVDEQARIDDGRLVLYSLKPLRIRQLLLIAPLLRLGKQRRAKEVYTAHGTDIRIRTTRPREVHADGEHLTWTPANFRVLPAAIHVLAPRPDGAGHHKS